MFVGGTCVGEEGRKRRLGFGKKGKSSFTVHRSEEVLPDDTSGGRSGRQPSSASSDGEGSGDGDRSDIVNNTSHGTFGPVDLKKKIFFNSLISVIRYVYLISIVLINDNFVSE